MKKRLCIFGAGGLGRELAYHYECDRSFSNEFQLIGYYDDTKTKGTLINGYNVLGGLEDLIKLDKETSVLIGIANSKSRKRIFNYIKDNLLLSFPTFISEKIIISTTTSFGKGSIVLPNCVVTTNCKIGDFTIIDVASTIGHDVNSDDFLMVYPGANISGNVSIGSCVEIGTGAQIIQKLTIGDNVIVGAGSVVIRDVISNVTVAGVPSKTID